MQGTAVAVPVQDTGDAFRASLAGALNTFLSAIPRIIGFVVVLVMCVAGTEAAAALW